MGRLYVLYIASAGILYGFYHKSLPKGIEQPYFILAGYLVHDLKIQVIADNRVGVYTCLLYTSDAADE